MSREFDRVQAPPTSLKAGPDSVRVTTWCRAIELEHGGQYGLAREYFRECLRSNDVDAADVHFHLGWCLEADGSDTSSALAHYLHAATLATDGPLGVNARYRAGLLALGDGDLEQAISLLQAARAASASTPALHDLAWHAAYWLGVCCEANDRILDAIKFYEEVTSSGEPGLRAEARYRRLQGLVAIGAFDAALQVAAELIESAESGDDRITKLAELAAEERRQLLTALRNA